MYQFLDRCRDQLDMKTIKRFFDQSPVVLVETSGPELTSVYAMPPNELKAELRRAGVDYTGLYADLGA